MKHHKQTNKQTNKTISLDDSAIVRVGKIDLSLFDNYIQIFDSIPFWWQLCYIVIDVFKLLLFFCSLHLIQTCQKQQHNKTKQNEKK